MLTSTLRSFLILFLLSPLVTHAQHAFPPSCSRMLSSHPFAQSLIKPFQPSLCTDRSVIFSSNSPFLPILLIEPASGSRSLTYSGSIFQETVISGYSAHIPAYMLQISFESPDSSPRIELRSLRESTFHSISIAELERLTGLTLLSSKSD